MAILVLPNTLDASVEQLPDVGKVNASRLAKLGIETIRDLLLTLPYAWDTFRESPISGLVPGTQASVVGTLVTIHPVMTKRRRLRIIEATVADDSGAQMRVVWFHSAYILKQLQQGDRVAFAGLVEKNRYRGQPGMVNPQHERLAAGGEAMPQKVGGMTPRYHLVDGLSSKKIAGWVEVVLPLADRLDDLLPPEVRQARGLLDIAEAVRRGHRPGSQDDFLAARKRMTFAELFELQAAFALMRARIAAEPATPIPFRQEVGDAFKSGLGFELTEAQRRATRDAFKDMQQSLPMNRLLNGDVGSGKTAVAAACAAMTHAAGMQTVVMAPTEILARQHLRKFRTYLEPTFPDLKVELLVSGLSAAERRRVRTAAASGHCAVVVGTHALIEEEVEFLNLGLAVVDEQHRFGTRQRELLRGKGRGRPHFLAMTATPIPRTLALALYGEMTLSVIDEMPPGRTPVETDVIDPDRRARAYDLVRKEVAAGHQAFVICPLIEESEAVVAKSATAEFDRLQREVFPDLRLGLIHGRLKDKDEVMQRFVSGEIQILVATAVVEVGVDVPNATVMMIEGADRFGLAQLHQFRGRVGRGSAAARCLLLADDPSDKSLARLELVARLRDGFALAEEDMRLRGTGELLGSRQHGMTDAAMDALAEPELLNDIREEAETIVQADPNLDRHPALKAAVVRRLELTSIS
ncbi:MAG TPA: ATP-dependent DNA helicase RecG [Candidatus Limnocylindrales bacterium]|nr:ATP-dependent DNA helicase RecG [Candidatus Limnocylindrales bacterium]